MPVLLPFAGRSASESSGPAWPCRGLDALKPRACGVVKNAPLAARSIQAMPLAGCTRRTSFGYRCTECVQTTGDKPAARRPKPKWPNHATPALGRLAETNCPPLRPPSGGVCLPPAGGRRLVATFCYCGYKRRSKAARTPSAANQMAWNRNPSMVNPVQKNHEIEQQSISPVNGLSAHHYVFPPQQHGEGHANANRPRSDNIPRLRAGANKPASACRRAEAKTAHIPAREGGAGLAVRRYP